MSRRPPRGAPLRAKQQRLLRSIEDLLEVDLWPYGGRAWESLSTEERRHLKLALQQFDRLILRAAQAGLEDHPMVALRIAILRALGDRGTLRRPRIGLEKGVRPPFSLQEVKIWDVIRRRRERGHSWAHIHRGLFREGRIKNMTKQAFDKLLARLDLKHTYILKDEPPTTLPDLEEESLPKSLSEAILMKRARRRGARSTLRPVGEETDFPDPQATDFRTP